MNSDSVTVTLPKPRTVRPWAVSCFVIGWGLLAILAILQDRAIDAQNDLIHILLNDLHQQLAQSVAFHRPAAQVLSETGTSSATSSSQAPSIQVPYPSSKVPGITSRTPSSQGKAAAGANAGRNSRRALRALPVRPPAQTPDLSDKRRVLFTT